MADGFSVQVKGLKDIEQMLGLVGEVAGERVMRSSLFEAAKPIQEQAVANISVIQGGSGALAKATRRVYLRSGGGTARAAFDSGQRFVVAIAPKVKDRVAIALANLRYKRRKGIRGIFWGHLVEWGHRIGNGRTGRLTRATTPKGQSKTRLHAGLGRVPGKLVFTRAAQSRGAEAIALFREVIAKRVSRAVKKLRP